MALLASIDALGWGVYIFVGLLFGIPYTRYFLRIRAIPGWPTTEATVTEAFVRRGLPGGYDALLYYCGAHYVYDVAGTVYKGRVAIGTGNGDLAVDVVQQVLQMRIPIRYNPKRPKDSLPIEKKVLGRPVIRRESWLNPRVW